MSCTCELNKIVVNKKIENLTSVNKFLLGYIDQVRQIVYSNYKDEFKMEMLREIIKKEQL